MVDLNELGKQSHADYNQRKTNGAKFSKGHLSHLATELVEAVEAKVKFKDQLFSDTFSDDFFRKNYAEELADIIICVINEATEQSIDIEDALTNKIKKNHLRAIGQGDKV